ncbi:E3 ubiquitin-protein ligase [Caligus rogercresseyi]|uniref:RING-type E3 ubiquitin transferase n=1 Tax=Caligus rogercresseyi TaxID=217165 RepID=A0A7T8K8M1_CALRO|nr:E3 ubiquitin-protein ligase [Caligus rogercresseyi]
MDPSSTSIGASSCSFPASQRKRKYESRYELLECPICLDLPRSGPLFGCKNGHLICNLCREKMSEKRIQCPVCRSSDVHCRNLIAEKLMEELLENNNILFECRFSTEGCKEKKEGRRIGDHEASCWYRCVDPCKWKGPIKNLVKHFAATRCAQVMNKTSH